MSFFLGVGIIVMIAVAVVVQSKRALAIASSIANRQSRPADHLNDLNFLYRRRMRRYVLANRLTRS
ncbi:MAG: hypothetical protein IT343_17605 [Candidatus Melainabacteria bacterium]|nr:hypothetical protein [Candidatus Melainabacteria bacterium]